MNPFYQIAAAVFAALLLIAGPRLFQRVARVGALGGIAYGAHHLLVSTGLVSGGLLSFAFAGLAALFSLSLLREPLALRWGSLFVQFGAILFLRHLWETGGHLGETATNVMTAVLAGIAVLSPSASAGLLSGFLLAYAVNLAPWVGGVQFALVLFGCVAVAWVRHGRLAARAVGLDPARIASSLRAGIQGGEAPPRETVSVALSFNSAIDLSRFEAHARARGWSFEALETLECAIVELPRERAFALQRLSHVHGLFLAGSPAIVDCADARVELPPDPIGALADGGEPISLEEIRQRLRTDPGGNSLPDGRCNGEGAHVAILDTGGEERPEYAAVLHQRVSFVPGESAEDRNSVRHGSNCGMIVNAVANRAKLSFVKVLSSGGTGQLGWILKGYAWALENHVNVINSSYGSCSCRGASTCLSCKAVESLRSKGVVFVSSAGNSGPAPRTIGCPAGSTGAIAVASADRRGRISRFSSRGPSASPGNPKPDVTAYGEAVLLRTQAHGPNSVPMNGTSFSSPQVAGLSAALVPLARAQNLTTVETTVRRAILDGCRQDQLAEGHRHPDAAGKGMVSLHASARLLQASERDEEPIVAPFLPWVVRRAALPAAALMGLLLVRATLVHSADALGVEDQDRQDIHLVGRVVEASGASLYLDDGTHRLPLVLAHPTLYSRPGSLVWARGDFRDGAFLLTSRILLASGQHEPLPEK